MDNTIDPTIKNLAKAIGEAETGGRNDPYNSGLNPNNPGGGSGEFGRYQFMPETYKAYAKKYLGDENAQPDVANQNKIVYSFVKEKKEAGYNPAQIASMWNAGEGRPNAYKENHQGVNKYGVQYNVPQYVEKVSNKYKEFSSQTPTPIASIPDQRQEMRNQGEAVSVDKDRAEPTTGGEILRDLIRPTATMLARPLQAIGAISGLTPEQQTIKSSYLGDIEAPTTAGDVVKDVGRGLQTISLGIGGGAAKNVVTGVATKKPFVELAMRGAKEGLQSGLLGGAGYATEKGEPIEEVAKQTAIGGGLGLAGGGLLGAVSPLVGKAGSALGSIPRQIKRGLQYGGVMDVAEKDAIREIDNVATEYGRASGTSIPNKFRQKNMTRSGEFVPAEKWLAENHIVPKEGPNKTWDVDGTIGEVDALNDEFQKTKNQFTSQDDGYYNVDEALKIVGAKIDDSFSSEIARESAKKKITDEVEAILQKTKPSLNEKGERIVRATEMERLRDLGNSLRKFDQMDPQGINQTAGDALSKAVNNVIDKYTKYPAYRSFNREWSNLLNARKWLEHLRGKTVRLSKGLSGQIAMKTLGPILGYSKGGIFGAILGDIGGEAAGKLLSDPELRTIISRSLIRKAGLKLSREEIIQQLTNEMAEYATTKASQLKLPAPSAIYGQPYKGGKSEMIISEGTPPPQDFKQGLLRRAGKEEKPLEYPLPHMRPEPLLLKEGNKRIIPGKPINLGKKTQSTVDKEEQEVIQKGILRRKKEVVPEKKTTPTKLEKGVEVNLKDMPGDYVVVQYEKDGMMAIVQNIKTKKKATVGIDMIEIKKPSQQQ